MGITARLSLPGYNAGTDTNPDHYSLYADEDNVLIKKYSSGVGTMPSTPGPGTTTVYSHNLGYIPFYTVYAKTNLYSDRSTLNEYTIVNNSYGVFQVPDIISAIDGTKLNITNFQGSAIPYGYDIFYDDMSLTGTPSMTESDYVFKVSRPNKEATSTNPNDYIVHSDLNNFKILSQGTSGVTIDSSYYGTVSHGANISPPYKYFAFMKFPDGKTMITGGQAGNSYDNSYGVTSFINGTNIIYSGDQFSGTAAYVVYGSGTTGYDVGGCILALTKPGYNAGTDTNPDNYNFHSNFPTLKYYTSGTLTMTNKTSTTYGTIPHNLGYTPFFVGFVNDLSVFYNSNAYAICPYYLHKSFIFNLNSDVGAFMYADGTNLYCKAWFDTNAVGTYSFTFYYKIFRNNLNL